MSNISNTPKDTDPGLPPCGAFLNSGLFSDFTITCKDRTFKVHRIIVCSQSSFFMTACTGNFKEASDSVIDLPEDDPSAVAMMLEFLYTGVYTHDLSTGDAIKKHGLIFGMAWKYDIEKLGAFAAKSFRLLLEDGATPLDDVLDALQLAYDLAEANRYTLLFDIFLEYAFDRHVSQTLQHSRKFKVFSESNHSFAVSFAFGLLCQKTRPEYGNRTDSLASLEHQMRGHQGNVWKTTSESPCLSCGKRLTLKADEKVSRGLKWGICDDGCGDVRIIGELEKV